MLGFVKSIEFMVTFLEIVCKYSQENHINLTEKGSLDISFFFVIYFLQELETPRHYYYLSKVLLEILLFLLLIFSSDKKYPDYLLQQS